MLPPHPSGGSRYETYGPHHSADVVNVRGRSYRMRAHQDAADGKNGR
jgi:hypothetical protein